MSYAEQAREIQREMAGIRSDLQGEVDVLVKNARVLTDWRYYVRTFPWACLAAGVAVGYLAVPRRLELVTPDADTLARLARRNRLVVRPSPEPQEKQSLAGAAVAFLGSLALKGALAYAGQQFGRMAGLQAAERPAEPSVSRPFPPPR